jgi:hypothetical protein
MKPGFFFTLMITFLLTACSKDKNNIETIFISGITERDNSGTLIGQPDETDWTSDTSFPKTIYSFLNFTDTVDYSNAEISEITYIEAYPNPINTVFVLQFGVSNSSVIKYIIVDDSLKLYTENAIKLQMGTYAIAIQTDSLYPKNKYYRLYYAFYDKTKKIFFKGHGDIKKGNSKKLSLNSIFSRVSYDMFVKSI